MNALLLTVLATWGGTNGDVYQYGMANGAGPTPAGYSAPADYGCETCNSGHGRHGGKGIKPPRGGWCGMMPQTCYNPRFGCYDGDRFNHRYPAFHGTYYRRPYNYRNVFDYPWHADLHEPTSNFAYNVNEAPVPAPVVPAAPVPTPDSSVQRSGARQAQGGQLRPVSHGLLNSLRR